MIRQNGSKPKTQTTQKDKIYTQKIIFGIGILYVKTTTKVSYTKSHKLKIEFNKISVMT